MERSEIMELLKCIANSTVDNLPDILEPVSKFSKPVGAVIKSFKDGIMDFNETRSQASAAVKEMAEAEPVPVFMDCVMYTCKKGATISSDRHNALSEAINCDFTKLSHVKKETRDVFSQLKVYYLAGDADENVDNYTIGYDYISINFFEQDDFPYSEVFLKQLMDALNDVLRSEVFNYFTASGHDKTEEEL